MAVTDSWENVQFGVVASACFADTVVVGDPVDGLDTPLVAVSTRVDVVELAG